MYRIVVVIVVALHFAFIGYVVIGGFLARRWPRTMWLHVPAVMWGIAIGTRRVDCPLTWAERWARQNAGMAPLPRDGFIAHYITGVICPANWASAAELATLAVVGISWMLFFRRDIHWRGRDRAITRPSDDEV